MAQRRARGTGSIVKRERGGKSWWEARVQIGYDPKTGKRIRKSYSGATQREVREKMQRDTLAVQEGEYFRASDATLASWLKIWLADFCRDKKPGTMRTYRAVVNHHLIPYFGQTKLSELSTPMIQRFYNQLAESGKTVTRKDKDGKPVITHESESAKTIRNVHGVLSVSLEKARSLGYIKRNPAADATTPRVERREIRPLTQDDLSAYLTAAADDRWACALQLLPLCGLRESELLGLTWDCVDFGTNKITVNKQLLKRSLDEGGYTLAPTKSSNVRTVVLPKSATDILRRRQQQQTEHRLQAGEAWTGWSTPAERKKALVFTTETGGHLTPNTLYYHAKKVLETIGRPDATVHDLRHTYATLSLHAGMDVKTLQDSLGHATAAFTLDVYGHSTDQMKQRAAEELEKLIFGQK